MANWACVPYTISLFTVIMYSVRSNMILLSFFVKLLTAYLGQLTATIKGLWMQGPYGFLVVPDDVVSSLIIALLTEIHYSFRVPRTMRERECSESTAFAMVKSY